MVRIAFYGVTAQPPDDCPLNDRGLLWGGLGARVWARDAGQAYVIRKGDDPGVFVVGKAEHQEDRASADRIVFGMAIGACVLVDDDAWSVQILEENGDITSVPLEDVIGRVRR